MNPTLKYLLIGLALASSLAAQTPGPRTVKCRVVLFEKVAGIPEAFYAPTGTKGEFTRNTFTTSVDREGIDYLVPASGQLGFLAGTALDSAVIARATVPPSVSQAYIFLVPDSNPADSILFQTIVVEDSLKSSPIGGAFFCNLISSDVQIALGEHKFQVLPGKTVSIPPPAEKDEYHMANLAVRARSGDDWVILKNSLYRFGERDRYLFFSYFDTSTKRPLVKIYMRSVPLVLPAAGTAANP